VYTNEEFISAQRMDWKPVHLTRNSAAFVYGLQLAPRLSSLRYVTLLRTHNCKLVLWWT